MTYLSGSKIEATDYNQMAFGGPTLNHSVPNISSVLGTGFGKLGYGQPLTYSPITTKTNLTNSGKDVTGWFSVELEFQPTSSKNVTWWPTYGVVNTNYSLNVRNRDTYYNPKFPVQPGDTFFCSANVIPYGGNQASFDCGIGLGFQNASGEFVHWIIVQYRKATDVGQKLLSGIVTVPPGLGITHALAFIQINAPWGTNWNQPGILHHVANIVVRPAADTNSLVVSNTKTYSPVTNTIVKADEFAYLRSNLVNLASHQQTTLSPSTVSFPAIGKKIQAASEIGFDVQNVYAKSLNAKFQGVRAVYTNTYTAKWKNEIVFNFTVNFDSEDAARYFFNAGGQLNLDFSHPAESGPSQLLSKLCSLNNGIGSLYISSATAETTVIVGNQFTGLTRASTTVNASGLPVPDVFVTNAGYYNLTTTPSVIFSLKGVNLSPSDRVNGFNNSSVKVFAAVNEATGNTGSNGNQLYVTVRMTQEADPTFTKATLLENAKVTLTVIEPSTAYLKKTWGTVSVQTSNTGS